MVSPKASDGEPQPASEAAPPIDVDQLRGLTTEDITSFKALGVEVCLRYPLWGEMATPVVVTSDRK